MSTTDTTVQEAPASLKANGKPREEIKTQLHADSNAAKKKGMNPETRKKILIIVGLLAIIGLVRFIYDSIMYVTTDNAMIQAQATLLSSRVSGIIVRSDVQENQKVKVGQVLAEIKPEDYQNTFLQINSDMESLAAQVKGAESNYRRTLSLSQKGAATQERLDAAESQYKSLDRKMKAAKAQVAQAQLNLDYTLIKAPSDGKVGKKSFEVGMLASVGQPLLGFVAGSERWVVANIKETDMDLVTEGKHALVSVDAISGREYQGIVESISPATGATFSLLPPDNATGNFTKVVQRVPVRIKLLDLAEKDVDRLQTGLSAEVKIKVH